MAGTFTPTPGSISNLSLLELEQLEKADFSAGSKALTQGYAGTGGFSINAEPYFTGPEMITREVLPSTISLTPGPYLNTGAHDFTVWMGPTILYEGTTGNASGVDKWYDSDSGLDFTAMGIVAGDLVLVKDTHQPTHENANIVGVISGIATHELTLSAQSAALTVNSDHYTYLIVHPTASQLFAVPGSGPLGQEQTFLSVAPGASIHNVPAPSLDDINLVRYPYIIPPYMSGSTVRDRADSVFGSPAPLTSLDSLGYRLILYPDDGAGAPDLAHPISALNPVIDPAVPSAEQRMTIDYRTGVIRFSCPAVPVTGDLNPAGYVNPITGRMNLYAVFWTYDLSNGPLDTVSALYVPLSTSLDFHDPARIYYDNVTNHAWEVQGPIRFEGNARVIGTFQGSTADFGGRVTIEAAGLATPPSIINTTLANHDIGPAAHFVWDLNTQAPYLMIATSAGGETPNLTLASGTSIGQRVNIQFKQSAKGRSGLTWLGSNLIADPLTLSPAMGVGACTSWELMWDYGKWIVTSKAISSNTVAGLSQPIDYLNAIRNLTQRFTSYQVAPATPPIGFPSNDLHRWYFGQATVSGTEVNTWLAAYYDTGAPVAYMLLSRDDCRTWIVAASDPGAAIQDVVSSYDESFWMCILQGSASTYSSTDASTWGATSGSLTMTDPRSISYLGVDGSFNSVFIVGGASATHPLERSISHGGVWDNTVYTGNHVVSGFAVNPQTGVALAYTDEVTGLVLKTVDYGASWTEITGSTTFYQVVQLEYLPGCGTWVMMSNNAGTYSVLNSVDDGVTWTVALASSPQFTKIRVFGPSLLVGIASDSDAAYLVSADRGATWKSMDGGGAWDVARLAPTAATDLATSSVYGPFSELLITHKNTTVDWSTAVSQRVVESNQENG